MVNWVIFGLHACEAYIWNCLYVFNVHVLSCILPLINDVPRQIVNVFSTLFQPVGFVTFDSRSGAEAAKNALNVSTQSTVTEALNYWTVCFLDDSQRDGPFKFALAL